MKKKWFVLSAAMLLFAGGTVAASALVSQPGTKNDSNKSLEGQTAASEASPSKSREELLADLTEVVYPSIPPEEQEAYIASQLASMAAELEEKNPKTQETDEAPVTHDSMRKRAEAKNLSVYEYCLEIANETQKAALEKLKEENPDIGVINDMERAILVIMGELPADQPRLTREWAEEFCKTHEWKAAQPDDPYYAGNYYREAMDCLNKVAGAPDSVSEKGYGPVAEYFVDEDGSERIVLVASMSIGYKKTEMKGMEELYHYPKTAEQEPTAAETDAAPLTPEEELLADIQKRVGANYDISREDLSFYTSRYVRANEEQRKQIDEVYDPVENSTIPIKQIMIIMGEIEADVPLLTLEEAKEAVAEMKKDSRFGWNNLQETSLEMSRLYMEYIQKVQNNAVPDKLLTLADGSITYAKFYLDPEQTEEVSFGMSSIDYLYTDKNNNLKIFRLLSPEECVVK